MLRTCSKLPCVALALLGMAAPAHASSPPEAPRAGTSAYAAARMAGFLAVDERPDSLALVPPPPRKGTAAYVADVDAYRAVRPLRDKARWQLAIDDANVKFPHAAGVFACALGVSVTEAQTPHLYRLLQRVMIDAGQSTYLAKDHYQRPRPFAVFDDRMCVPDDEKLLRKSGAYPSGHASAGWAWALVLAEIAPDRATAILRRGYEFGVSRLVCGVHWQSDVETGRTVGAATVARLHAKPEFLAELALARDELVRARAEDRPPAACGTEAQALAATAGL
jgi:acid phosphatase (class A)